MSDGRHIARKFADALFYNAALSFALMAAIFLAIPVFVEATGAMLFLWPAFILAAFATLGLSIYLVFDALLFRLISSYVDVESGCRAVDAYLRRTGLREEPETPRSLDDRIAGTRKMLNYQRAALLVFLALFVSMVAF